MAPKTKQPAKNKGGRPSEYHNKTWRPGILCSEELKTIAAHKAGKLGLSVSDAFERGMRELKVS